MINDLWYKNAVVYCLSGGDLHGRQRGRRRGLRRSHAQARLPAGLGASPRFGSCRFKPHRVVTTATMSPTITMSTHALEPSAISSNSPMPPGSAAFESSSIWWSITPPTSMPGSSRRARIRTHRIETGMSGRKRNPAMPTRALVFPGVQKSTWSFEPRARAWYFHRFYDFQPDLNTANPHVQAEILKIMGFWIQLGVSGLSHGRGAVRHRHQGCHGGEASRAIRHAAHLSRIFAVARGRRHHSSRGQRLTRHGHAVFRACGRSHAHDVQLRRQSKPVLRVGGRRRAALEEGTRSDKAPPEDGAMGHVSTQSRRVGSWAPDRDAT